MRKMRMSGCAVLSLVLKRKWYDMIESGKKIQEYRSATPYWAIRLSNWDKAGDDGTCIVEFRLGYAKDAPRMAFISEWYVHDCRSIHPEWGEPDTPHYVIHLGERVELLKEVL